MTIAYFQKNLSPRPGPKARARVRGGPGQARPASGGSKGMGQEGRGARGRQGVRGGPGWGQAGRGGQSGPEGARRG